MDARLLSVLACPACSGDLDFTGEVRTDRVTSGVFRCTACGMEYPVDDEIPYLVSPDKEADGAFAPEMEEQVLGWIETNFARMQTDALSAPAARMVDTICSVEGVVVDVASGPGGGYCVPVMQRANPRRVLVMSDLGVPVMPSWRRVLRGAGWADRCSNLSFDARRLPFKEGSVQAITSVAGMDNVHNNLVAYGEAARVLAAGGLLLDVVFFYAEGGPTHRFLAEQQQAAACFEDYSALLDRLDFGIEGNDLLKSGQGKVDAGDGLPLQEDEAWEIRVIQARRPVESGGHGTT